MTKEGETWVDEEGGRGWTDEERGRVGRQE